MDNNLLDTILRSFLREDIGRGDLTSEAIFPPDQLGSARLVARERFLAAGVEAVAARVFALQNPSIESTGAVADGVRVEPGDVLLTVSGVGPKVALAILSTLSPELLKSAIMREETAVLQRVPGIGKKTAERIMFQLRDKLDLSQVGTSVPLISDVDADVIDILTSLGFSIVEAQSALQNLPREVKNVDDRVQLALQYLDQG